MLELARQSESNRIVSALQGIAKVLETENLRPILTIMTERDIVKEEASLFSKRDVTKDDQIAEILRACEEPRAKQATLAALASHKASLVKKLKSGSDDTDTVVQQLLRLVNVDDEPILHELITANIFDPEKRIAGVSLPGHTALALLTFFLGYCKSDE